jgi:hypothetical protein
MAISLLSGRAQVVPALLLAAAVGVGAVLCELPAAAKQPTTNMAIKKFSHPLRLEALDTSALSAQRVL